MQIETKRKKCLIICGIWGSLTGGYEELYLLGLKGVKPVESQIRRNMSHCFLHLERIQRIMTISGKDTEIMTISRKDTEDHDDISKRYRRSWRFSKGYRRSCRYPERIQKIIMIFERIQKIITISKKDTDLERIQEIVTISRKDTEDHDDISKGYRRSWRYLERIQKIMTISREDTEYHDDIPKRYRSWWFSKRCRGWGRYLERILRCNDSTPLWSNYSPIWSSVTALTAAGCDMLRQLVRRQGLSLSFSLCCCEGHTICVALEIRPWIDAETDVFIHQMAFWRFGDLASVQDCDVSV
jgi:hypothetical protein